MAGIVVATLAATAAIVATQLAPHPQGYAVPGNPCAMVSPATLARYLPSGSVSGPLPGSSLSLPGVSKVSGCSWTSGTGDLTVQVSVYGSATGSTGAKQAFDQAVRADSRAGPGSGVSTTGERSVARLGNEAEAIFHRLTPGPSSFVDLHIWSDNAEVVVSFGAFSKQAGTPQLVSRS